MALFEYDLFLVRGAGGGSLLAEMVAGGDVAVEDESAAQISAGLRCLYAQFPAASGATSMPGRLRLGFLRHQIEPMLRDDARRFLDWLWAIFERYRLDYAFMGGADVYQDYHSREPVTDQGVTEQLDELLADGTIRIPHPLMLFAERLGGGRACALAESAPHYQVEQKPGVGCLLVLSDGDLEGDSIEILQPGMIYPHLVRHFREAARRRPAGEPTQPE
jgi:hypothetical protein